ncbi:MAG: IscS subfamily cysteine desulfurase [Alphaproteobacteria bacterium]|jgi:cysteine desulfurase|nr:IscS subfamily cysteine desulfurase [Alphaproteobacteria bacterium]
MENNKVIYLDYQATTPTDPRVVEKMLPYFFDNFGNPHSRNHSIGWSAEEAVEDARKNIAKLINANAKDIIFTSGATEANNLALKGVMEFYGKQGKNHLIISSIEHKCILSSAYDLEEKGFEITILPVEINGIIDLEKLKNAITDKTALVSIMAVNNEIGTIQPIKEIGAICREKGVFFHTDAAQAVGKIPMDVEACNIDLMSISAHKMYGPMGIGALYVRRKPRVRVLAQMHGGGQERGIRSGTLPLPLCVGFGEAARLATVEMDEETKRLTMLSKKFKDGINKALRVVYLNGDAEKRICTNLNMSFAGVEGESLLMGLNKYIAVSSGSACTSASLESSYVLKAIGLPDELAHTSIRFGIGRFTTEQDIDTALEKIITTVNRLREMSPIWEMMEAGIDLSTIQWAEH